MNRNPPNLAVWRKRAAYVMSLSLLGFHPTRAMADSWLNPVKSFRPEVEDITGQKTLLLHPFMHGGRSQRYLNGLGLIDRIKGSLDQHVREIMRLERLDPRIELRGVAVDSVMKLHADRDARKYRFYVGGIELCELELKALTLGDGQPIMIGNIPSLAVYEPPPLGDWPDEAAALDTAHNAAIEDGVEGSLSLKSKSPCLHVAGDELRPAWVMQLEAEGGLRYEAIADDYETYSFSRSFFDATGKAKVFPHNSIDSSLEEVTLREMDESAGGKLKNKYFYTYLDTTKYNHAVGSDYVYNFSPGTSEFDETSVFAHANQALEWFESVGYSDFGSKQIRLHVHATIQGDPNNALYQPGSDSVNPSILIGDGDGTLLKNLATDSDVVGHELGHHIVFKTIRTVKRHSEPLVLHEGLADYFNFARTGNACLGESICPEGSPICEVDKQCLRTADNDYTLLSPNLPSEDHLRSQFISGMLWDLRTEDGIPGDQITRIVLKSIDYMIANSGYQHFVLALLTADKELFKSEHCEKIYKRAESRGLKELIKQFNCSSELPAITDLVKDVNSNTTSSGEVRSKSKSGSNLCGVVGAANGPTRPWSLALLFGLPLMVAWLWRRRTAAAVSPSDS